MEFTAEQIAGLLQGEVDGNPSASVNGLAKIEEGNEGSLSFLSNPKYEDFIYTTGSSICIVNKTFSPSKALPTTLTLIRVDDAYACFAKLLEIYNSMNRKEPEIEQPSFIHQSATIGSDPYVGAFAYIGKHVKIGNNVQIYPNVVLGDNVQIGDNTILFANVSIYADCQIGNNVTIHSGTVIGSDGFGYAPDENRVYQKIPQIGNLIIEDDVNIGAGTTIDRATMGSTIIRKGVKLDNQIQVGHNVEIGENTVIAAQTGIAGSTKIGKNCMIGGQVGFAGHITVGDNVHIQGKTGVTKSVKDGEILQGNPAMSYKEYYKSYVHFKNLPTIVDDLEKLKLNSK